MIRYVESDLAFSFGTPAWVVRKYDQHTYYKGLSGAGLKGVDFLGLYKSDRLVLIEVKNFSRNQGVSLDFDSLEKEIEQKTRHTLTGLDAIHQMLERKWIYRFASPLLRALPARHYDWPFWAQVVNRLHYIDQVVLLFILVGVEQHQRDHLASQLRLRLSGEVGTAYVLNENQFVFEDLKIESI